MIYVEGTIEKTIWKNGTLHFEEKNLSHISLQSFQTWEEYLKKRAKLK